ncbi:MAG: FkbM family methyltransferase [Candidatus Bathyarchaeia archaeon]
MFFDINIFVAVPRIRRLMCDIKQILVTYYRGVKFVSFALFLPFMVTGKLLKHILNEEAYRKVGNKILGLYLSEDGPLLFRITDYFAIHDVFEAKSYDHYYSIKPNFITVDVGAHIGAFTLHCARRASQVLAIEPCTSNYKVLNMNIRLNRLKNVIPLKLALFSHEGIFRLYVSSETTGYSMAPSIVKRKKMRKYLTVKAITFDNLAKISGIE